VNGTESW